MIGLRRSRSRPDTRIEVPPRTFDAALPRRWRFLLWTWTRIARRRFVVAGLPLRELLVVYEKLRLLSGEMEGLAPRESLVVALGDRDALRLTAERARMIWEAWQEANCLSLGASEIAGADAGERETVLGIVFRLGRWPFNLPEERILAMTAAEAVARLDEWRRNGPRDGAPGA